MRKEKEKNGVVKKVAIGAAIGVGVLAFVGLAVKVNRMDKTDTLSPTFAYEQGLLSTTDGTQVKGKTAIRTKDFISLDGFKVDLKDDASVTYQLFYYNENDEFVSASEELSADYDVATASLSGTEKKVRIVVTPKNDPEVSIFEIAGYASELDVEWNKA